MRVWTAALMMVIGGAVSAVAAPLPSVVSLDYCADQFVLALADRGQILAVSPAAGAEYSYMAERARGLPRVRPTAEAVLMLAPDIVVRQWGGGFGAPEVLGRFGIPVAQIGDDVSLTQARASLIAIGAALGQSARAEALAAGMDRRLAALAATSPESRPRALYVTAGGMSSGAGTFIDAILEAAGVRNLTAEKGRSGWAWVDMEALALDPPDLFVTGFFDKRERVVDNWSPSRHAFLREELASRPTVHLSSRQVACSAWFVVDAIEAVAATRSALK
jgi:iron complex transport system substrate-binding protein